MSRALLNHRGKHGGVLFLSCILTLGLCPVAEATTICDTDPAATPYTPTVDPTLLNALIDTLGAIDVSKTSGTGVRLLYNHTLNVTLNSSINLGGADFIVTPGFGTMEVDLMIPGWSTNLSTSMTHAACRNCNAEYTSCNNGCDNTYNSCVSGCVNNPSFPCYGVQLCCETGCGTAWTACQGVCAGAYPICQTDAAACSAERAAINVLLSGYSFGMSFSSASVTQNADICVSGECQPKFPVETTVADLNGFTLHLFPTGDPLGVGSWLNGIISSLVNWALNIESTIASFFETPEGEGVLILPFGLDIATDGCLPAQPVLDCIAGGCSTVERPESRIHRSANMLFYALPVAFLLGLLLLRRRRTMDPPAGR